ncbi:MAG: LysM peptidoglycan-binding domain-containing protein, partial [Chitinophagales bacterium]
RSDPVLATNAAAHLLSDLYNIYGDWQLAIASYNAGPGNVNKAIAKAGGERDFWAIREFLPKETQNYVPLYIACSFVMYYHEEFDILPQRPTDQLFYTDSVRIYDKVSLDYIAHNLGLDKDYLALLNPSLKTNIIPKSEEGFLLQLPYDYLGQFAAMEEIIMDDITIAEVEAEIIEQPEYIVYKVKSGDTLGHIAEQYNTSVSKIKQWNGLSGDFLNIGQKLTIY